MIICTPDKDLAQCVRGTRVVQMNRRTRTIRDEAGVIAKFGVPPTSIPDYLALVGDASDGYPGLPGWGEKSAAAVLAKFGHLEAIPDDWRAWSVNAAGAGALARTLRASANACCSSAISRRCATTFRCSTGRRAALEWADTSVAPSRPLSAAPTGPDVAAHGDTRRTHATAHRTSLLR